MLFPPKKRKNSTNSAKVYKLTANLNRVKSNVESDQSAHNWPLAPPAGSHNAVSTLNAGKGYLEIDNVVPLLSDDPERLLGPKSASIPSTILPRCFCTPTKPPET